MNEAKIFMDNWLETKVTEGWFKQLIKEMKESLKTGLRYYPREDDVAKLEQTKALIREDNIKRDMIIDNRLGIKKPEVTEEWIQEKTMEMIEIISKGKILEAMSFIRKLVEEIHGRK